MTLNGGLVVLRLYYYYLFWLFHHSVSDLDFCYESDLICISHLFLLLSLYYRSQWISMSFINCSDRGVVSLYGGMTLLQKRDNKKKMDSKIKHYVIRNESCFIMFYTVFRSVSSTLSISFVVLVWVYTLFTPFITYF